jgi:hypothetical protein
MWLYTAKPENWSVKLAPAKSMFAVVNTTSE